MLVCSVAPGADAEIWRRCGLDELDSYFFDLFNMYNCGVEK